MKRYLINISLFCAVVFVVVLILNTFQKYFNNEPPHYKMQYIEATDSESQYNAIIIGNSQATHAIRPSILDTLNIKHYNLALNASSPRFYMKWLNHLFIDNHPKVDYWIISTSFGFLNNNSWRKFEQDAEFFPFKDFSKMLWENNELDKKLLLSNRWPVLKYRARILNSFETNWESYEFIAEEYDRGYITLKRNDIVDLTKSQNFKVKLTTEAKIKFIKLIDKIDSLDGKIIFVIPTEYNININQYGNFKDFFLELSQERNIPLYDFNDEMYKKRLNKVENFVDFYHLSGTGSKIYSTILKETIYNIQCSILNDNVNFSTSSCD